MPTSLNAMFGGSPPTDAEYQYPHGCYIARTLHDNLVNTGWNPSDFDNWHDCGWCIYCRKDGSELIVNFGLVEDDAWLLQISPSYIPGIFGKLFKRIPSASPAHCVSLSKEIHKILSADKYLHDFHWCWDGYPSKDSPADVPNS